MTVQTEELVYKKVGSIELKATVYFPKEQGEGRTGIVFFGGGGWRTQNPQQFMPHSKDLAMLGVVSVTAEYRTSNQHSATPVESIKDAKSAVRWLRSSVEKFGIDPKRVVASGGSAGGHIAACAGMLPGFEEDADLEVSSVPDALVLFNPAFDLAESPGAERRMERPEFRRMVVGLEDISPMRHVVPGLPPTLIFHGTEDELVPISQVQRFKQKMKDAGNTCILIEAEGEGHGFFNYHRSQRWYNESMVHVKDFLSSCFDPR
jgi:acetyl esterase/lipase